MLTERIEGNRNGFSVCNEEKRGKGKKETLQVKEGFIS